MKVNTDGVLLGASMTIRPEDKRLLDIGTGTGTIALMAAQRSCAGTRVDAIDIDEASASEAAANFGNSPWSENMMACNMSLDEFANETHAMYDLIFSNPPYFEDSLTAPDERKSTARHTSDGLSYRDIFDFASERLVPSGRVSLVLPADQERSAHDIPLKAVFLQPLQHKRRACRHRDHPAASLYSHSFHYSMLRRGLTTQTAPICAHCTICPH